MNYDEHIQRHLARQAKDQAHEKDEEAQRLADLHRSCQQAENLVREIILPELELLQSSVHRHQLECIVKTGKQKFEGIAAEFEAEVYASSSPVKLLFRAEVGIRAFAVTLRRSVEDKPNPEMLRYDEITTQTVQEHCARFMTTAFPA
jgi:hypothetical protein